MDGDEDGVAIEASYREGYGHVAFEAGVLGQAHHNAVEPVEAGNDGQGFNRQAVTDAASVHP